MPKFYEMFLFFIKVSFFVGLLLLYISFLITRSLLNSQYTNSRHVTHRSGLEVTYLYIFIHDIAHTLKYI